MKVLHLSSENGWRGGEQQIAYLLEELSHLGVNNIVIARRSSEFETYCRAKKIPVVGVPFSNSADLRTANIIKNICHNEGIDLVHMHSAKSHSLGVLSAWLGNKTPLILSRRVDFIPGAGWFTKWKYNHASIKKVLCVSHKIDSIMRQYLRQPEKSITVHSGVDLSRFKTVPQRNALRAEFGIDESTLIVGNTSALEGHKDYFTFIRTIAALIRRSVKVHGFIMGSGSLEEKLRDYVRELSLENIITFTGYRRDVTTVLPSLDVFLMSSNEEGLGTSVLDAFLARVAVVATRAGGIPEMVIDGKSGLLAPVGDAEKLAENIQRLAHDLHLRKRLTDGALEVVQEFSKENTAQKKHWLFTEKY